MWTQNIDVLVTSDNTPYSFVLDYDGEVGDKFELSYQWGKPTMVDKVSSFVIGTPKSVAYSASEDLKIAYDGERTVTATVQGSNKSIKLISLTAYWANAYGTDLSKSRIPVCTEDDVRNLIKTKTFEFQSISVPSTEHPVISLEFSELEEKTVIGVLGIDVLAGKAVEQYFVGVDPTTKIPTIDIKIANSGGQQYSTTFTVAVSYID